MNAFNPNAPSGEPIDAGADIDSYNTPVPQITLINERDTPALMSKKIFLDSDGKLKSDGSECRMITGTAVRAPLRTPLDATSIAYVPDGSKLAVGYISARLDLWDLATGRRLWQANLEAKGSVPQVSGVAISPLSRSLSWPGETMMPALSC